MSDNLYTADEDFGARGNWTVLAAVIIAGFLVTLGLVGLLRTGSAVGAREATPVAADAGAAADPSTYILEALLATAIERDTVPLRWADPRAAMDCGPHSHLNVDRQALRPGTAVPVVPFVLDWEAHGCHPFGQHGPRFDGRVRLTVFHEDWGFSAMVEPAGMLVTTSDGHTRHVRQGSASMDTTGEDHRAPVRARLAIE